MLRLSTRCDVEIVGNNRDSAVDRCKGRFAVEATARPQRQAIQEFYRGHAVHHQERRVVGLVQGHRPSDHQGSHRAGSSYDDQGAVNYLLNKLLGSRKLIFF